MAKKPEAEDEAEVVLHPNIPAGAPLHPVHTMKPKYIENPVRGKFTRSWFKQRMDLIRMLKVSGRL